jgi:hypothetical protein
MAKSKSPGKRKTHERALAQTIPQRIRRASENLKSVLQTLLWMRKFCPGGEFEHHPGTLHPLMTGRYQYSLVHLMPNARNSLLPLDDYFRAAYLHLCHAAQVVQPPRSWPQTGVNYPAPLSHHAAAYKWARERYHRLRVVLDERSETTGQSQIEGWSQSQIERRVAERRDKVAEWAAGMQNIPDDALPMLGIEETQALLIWKSVAEWKVVPTTGDNSQFSAHNGANFLEHFSTKIPTSPKLQALWTYLVQNQHRGLGDSELAREHAGKPGEGLLRQLWNAKSVGKVSPWKPPRKQR